MKSIIVPVNFSASSDNAARYAADMALAINANLYLIHVSQIPVSTVETVNGSIFEEIQAAATDSLKELWNELVKRTAGKVAIFTTMEVGNVEYKLEELCLQKNPFVVIMGAAGTSMERVFAGSKTTAAIRNLPYPLIVVPDNAVFHSIRKIVLACDLYDIASGTSLTFLQHIREVFNADFAVINISTGRQERQDEADASFAFDSWKEKLREMYPQVHFVKMKTVEEGINAYLNAHPAELLLVFPKKHSFLEFHKSQAKKIALHCPIPVMSVHE